VQEVIADNRGVVVIYLSPGHVEVQRIDFPKLALGARKMRTWHNPESCLASLDLELSAEQLKSLDGASQIELGFPQALYEKEMVRATMYGGMGDRLLV
jgi:hypothetical protein